jgi:Rubisco LSMT substrate-binding
MQVGRTHVAITVFIHSSSILVAPSHTYHSSHYPLPSHRTSHSLSSSTQPLETVDFNEPISPSLERRVLTTMISICESYLEQYPTRVEDDEALMMNRVEYGK